MDLGSITSGTGASSYLPKAKKPSLPKPEGKEEDRAAKIAHVRDRMRDGYYRSGEVDEAISDKLSGAFDTFA